MMRWMSVFAVPAIIIGIHGQYTQKAKGCGIPIVDNTAQVPDPSTARHLFVEHQEFAMAGIWYKHRQSGIVTTNQILNITTMNRTGLPFSMLPAVGYVMQTGQYNDDSDNCVNRYFIGLCGVNGQCPGRGLTSVDDFSPASQDMNIIYLDVGNFVMFYVCAIPNYKSGMCDKPSFHVGTRSRPDKMSAEQVKAIDDTVDEVLGPYCFSASDIDKQMYTDGKPFCVQIDYPPCIKSMITALENQIKNSISN